MNAEKGHLYDHSHPSFTNSLDQLAQSKEMEFFIVLTVFLLIASIECLSAQDFPHPSNLQWLRGECWKMNGSQLFDENHFIIALQFQVVTGNETVQNSKSLSASKEEFYFSEDSSYFYDCQSLVEHKSEANRLPQVMPSVRCLQTGIDNSSKRFKCHRRIKCEEVKLIVPVLREKSVGEGRGSYGITFETTSVACVRTVPPPCMRSKTGHRVFFDGPS
ncbi:hypothetical protein AVEN_174674-1 [Araneus ventricosus]|uniref:Uncharacterized protein n=1 Tax=Araneus ventricosus TaxID=182803 RepID=A0A4Y2BLV4_ARAVE|nr:hypothetical protein AVEN_174674-1 [Araneus ventricosus]